MHLLSLVASAALLPITSSAQSSSTTSAPVPTSTPVTGIYNGLLRPQVHFSPPAGFMNDPNGMFKDEDGLWHLYYQYNPTAVVAGNQHWGHATSMDLYHWENQKIAIFPPNGTSYIYSGSAVTDPNNTSGFFPNQTNGVVAMYTIAGAIQNQNIAWSVDGGYTFTPYASNPVIDINSTQFRDPKVIWHAETQRWVVVLAYASDFVIGIYTSPDLRKWTHASNFSHAGLLGVQYECPNMVEMPMYATNDLNSTSTGMYVMQISINPGAPLGGSISQYFPGTFNGTHFTAVDDVTRLTDFAKDNYAGQFFYGIPGNEPQVSIAWASNWQYTQVVPTASEGWRSSMSLPRLNYLTNTTRIGYTMVSAPYDLSPLLLPSASTPLVSNSSLGNGSLFVDLSPSVIPSSSFYFSINVTSIPAVNTTGSINVTILSSASGEMVQLGQLPLGGDLFVSRASTYGFDNPFFTDKFSVSTILDPDGAYRLEGVFDRSILEVFINGGEKAGTVSVYPEQLMDTLFIKAGQLNEGIGVDVAVWGLESAWAQYENATTGVVFGNVSTSSSSSSMGNGKRDGTMGGYYRM